jgi:hypothetical protein
MSSQSASKSQDFSEAVGDESTDASVCYHCANTVPQVKIGMFRGQELFEHLDGRRWNVDYDYELFQCPTCRGVSVFGDFSEYPKYRSRKARRIYPRGPQLLPDSHMLFSKECVPERIVALYEEIWPLRHIAPNAFASQIRRALEFICRDQNAQGNSLFKQLRDLISRGIFPGYFAEITDLMRHVGNLGAHAGDTDVDFWDAELLDDFFRSIVEYVYIAPSKIKRLRQRIAVRTS